MSRLSSTDKPRKITVRIRSQEHSRHSDIPCLKIVHCSPVSPLLWFLRCFWGECPGNPRLRIRLFRSEFSRSLFVFAILWLVGVIAATCFIWNTPRLQFAVSLAWLLLFLVAGFVMNIWTVWQITAVI